jgi:hypothetical protein
MGEEFIGMLSYGENFGVHIFFESSQRGGCVFGIPYRRCGHPKDLRSQVSWMLEVFPHYAIICVVLASVMTLIDDQQGNLANFSHGIAR